MRFDILDSRAETAMARRNWGLLLTGAPAALAVAALPIATLPAPGADLAVRAPPAVTAPVAEPFSWTGWYIGANAGFGVGQGYGTFTSPGNQFDAFNAMPAGGFGGGQLGYNYQFSGGFLGSIVVGAETDIQGAGIQGAGISSPLATVDSKLNWFGTTRGRAGLATGPVLSYVTAGVAYGGIETGAATPAGSVASSTTRTGFTWGTGVEASLGGSWTAKAEYLYINFGGTNTGSPAIGAISVKNQEQMFRGGINYRFDSARPAAIEPARNWAGFFAGVTLDAGIGRNSSTLSGPGAADAFFLSPRGFDGGGIAGYNWQFGNWVVGAEGDFQHTTGGTGYVTSLADAGNTLIDQKLLWFGTARGRLGYSAGGALFYVTGGGAWGDVKDSITQTGGAASFSHTAAGFAVGAGIENRFDVFGLLGPNWTTRTEYLLLDLGSVNDTLGRQTLNSSIQEHIWRTVVSYKFGTP